MKYAWPLLFLCLMTLLVASSGSSHPLDGESCGPRCPPTPTPGYVCNEVTNCADQCNKDGFTLEPYHCSNNVCVADTPIDCNLELGGPPGFCMLFLGTYRCVFPP